MYNIYIYFFGPKTTRGFGTWEIFIGFSIINHPSWKPPKCFPGLSPRKFDPSPHLLRPIARRLKADLDGGHNFLSHGRNAGLVWPNRTWLWRIVWMCIPASGFLNPSITGDIFYTTGVWNDTPKWRVVKIFWHLGSHFEGKRYGTCRDILIFQQKRLKHYEDGPGSKHTSWSRG
jgi:hypothetical protein